MAPSTGVPSDLLVAFQSSLSKISDHFGDLTKTLNTMITVTKQAEEAQKAYNAVGPEAVKAHDAAKQATLKSLDAIVNASKKTNDELLAIKRGGGEELATQARYEQLRQMAASKTAIGLVKAETKEKLEALAKIAKQAADFNKTTVGERGFGIFKDKVASLGSSLGPVGKDVLKLTNGLSFLGMKGIGAMAGWTASIWALSEMFKIVQSGTENASLFAYAGGIMNDALGQSIALQPSLAGWLVDSADATKAATGVLANYGMQTTDMIQRISAGNSIISYSSRLQTGMYDDLYKTSVYLAKMGPMFGMAADEAGQTMGKLAARFHMAVTSLKPGFEGMGRVAMGLGIQTSDMANILSGAGDQLRWFNKEGMDPLMKRFTVLGVQMLSLAKAGERFWKGLGPGEMAQLFQQMVDVWSKMPVSTYMALRPGAGATSIGGLTSGIKEFYEKDPVSAMRQSIMEMANKFTASGAMTQDQAFMLMSTTGPFAEFGKAGPALFDALTSLSERQLKEIGGGDMNKFLDWAKTRFPTQAANLEAIRDTQLIMGDPLKNIQRAIIKILNLLVNVTTVGIGNLIPGVGAAIASDIPPWQKSSPGTSAVNKSGGGLNIR